MSIFNSSAAFVSISCLTVFTYSIVEKILGFNRDEVFERLKENGIRVRKYFYPLTNTFEYFYRKYDMNCTPVALGIANSILTLPLYDELSLSEVDRICDVILGMKSRAL